MMKPKILLSAGVDATCYDKAFAGVGADPVMGYKPQYDDSYAGLVLCGGNDIHPGYYGRDIMGSVNIDAERDRWEMELVDKFLAAGKPIFGLCRGFQLLNAYFGGTLVQDLPNKQEHRIGHQIYGTHQVLAVPGSILERLYGRVLHVNTNHHQGIECMGAELLPAAYHGKLVEAFVHARLPVLAVQWHPERMCFDQAREDTDDGSVILKYFVEMCK